MNDEVGSIIAFAATAPMLLLLLAVFRVVPWTKTGPWRTVIALAALASSMFMLAEVVLLAQPGTTGLDPQHQLPLFLALLSASAAATLSYLEGARATERARRLALTDPLTGLRNRRAFEEALTVAYEQRRPFAVVYIDLDGFKAINDRYGHDAGDKALQHAAAALLRSVREIDTAARLGGDEFALLLAGTDEPSAERVARRALDELRSVPRDHPEWSGLDASFGVAAGSDAQDAHALLDRADKAMYAAKRAGGGRISFATRS
ncbi:MAG: GGDEF domain-containing protein [Chloroflexota bacterium]|nr:GGDEF domain-containing protein [Chloroflexota bacterium]MDE3101834.1 GGDEF domain-containing protein [Chloroflexota bacterium]